MRIYKDSKLQELISDNTLDLGTMLAGETYEYTFYVQNDSPAKLINIKFAILAIDNKDISKAMAKEIKILESPEELMSGKVETLKLKWMPAVDLKAGLKVQLEISRFEVWG